MEKGRGSVTGKERPAENLLEAATGSRRYGSTIIESRVLHDQRALCFKSYFGSSLEKKKRVEEEEEEGIKEKSIFIKFDTHNTFR